MHTEAAYNVETTQHHNTAQEVHLVTTESKAVDKYTVEQKRLGILT